MIQDDVSFNRPTSKTFPLQRSSRRDFIKLQGENFSVVKIKTCGEVTNFLMIGNEYFGFVKHKHTHTHTFTCKYAQCYSNFGANIRTSFADYNAVFYLQILANYNCINSICYFKMKKVMNRQISYHSYM